MTSDAPHLPRNPVVQGHVHRSRCSEIRPGVWMRRVWDVLWRPYSRSRANYSKLRFGIVRMESSDTKTSKIIDEGDFDSLTEGKATILYEKGNKVFYNPVQEFNRDLSTACINEFAKLWKDEKQKKLTAKAKRRAAREAKEREKSGDKKAEAEGDIKVEDVKVSGVRILEALSATGLRSIRYWKEIDEGLIDNILVNDLDLKAVETIERNITYNGIDLKSLRPNKGDACDVLYANRCLNYNQDVDRGFDVIDLDPYGSAIEFLDGAVQAVSDGGLLCVTCTDKAILCGGKNPETCFGKYGSMPLRGAYCHEMAVRIVLHAIHSSACRYKRHIIPLLSMSIDFYVRVFVRVEKSKLNVKSRASLTSLVYQSLGCDAFHLQPMGTIDKSKRNWKYNQATGPPCDTRCKFTGSRHKVLGPTWSGPLHDAEFVEKVLMHVKKNPGKYGTEKRITGQLTVCKAELPNPLYYVLDYLSKTFHTNFKIIHLRSAIINAGYKVSQSHSEKNAIKTDAPPEVIMDIMKQIVELNPEIVCIFVFFLLYIHVYCLYIRKV
ncbi:hypothetical protein AAMO2058_000484700 [Amorphochlora amoebiformis]